MPRCLAFASARALAPLCALVLLLPACQIQADPPPRRPDPPMPVTRPDPGPLQSSTIGRTELDRALLMVECPGDPALAPADQVHLCRMLAQSLADEAPGYLVRLLAPGERAPSLRAGQDRLVALRLTRVAETGLSGRLDQQGRGGEWRSGPELGFDRVGAPGLSPEAIAEFARQLARTLNAA